MPQIILYFRNVINPLETAEFLVWESSQAKISAYKCIVENLEAHSFGIRDSRKGFLMKCASKIWV